MWASRTLKKKKPLLTGTQEQRLKIPGITEGGTSEVSEEVTLGDNEEAEGAKEETRGTREEIVGEQERIAQEQEAIAGKLEEKTVEQEIT